MVLVPPGALSALLLFLLFYLALPDSNGNPDPTRFTKAGASLCPGSAQLAVWLGKSNVCSRAGPLVTFSTSSTRASCGACRHWVTGWVVVTVWSGYLTHRLISSVKIKGLAACAASVLLGSDSSRAALPGAAA